MTRCQYKLHNPRVYTIKRYKNYRTRFRLDSQIHSVVSFNLVHHVYKNKPQKVAINVALALEAGMKSRSRSLGLETLLWNVSVSRKSGKVSVSSRSRASTSRFTSSFSMTTVH